MVYARIWRLANRYLAVVPLSFVFALVLGGYPGGAATTDGPGPSAVLPQADGMALIEAQITRVVDGSSLDAYVAGRRTAIGYLGADTPAANLPCGQEALARNRELAGRLALLEEDVAYPFDELGRRLYYAYTPEGLSIDATLIWEGLARAARPEARHGPELAALQAEAEAAGRGCLWGGPARS